MVDDADAAPITCTNCGRTIDPGSERCGRCGFLAPAPGGGPVRPLGAPGAFGPGSYGAGAPARPGGPPPGPAGGRSRWPLLGLVALVVVGAIVAAVVLLGGNDDDEGAAPDETTTTTKPTLDSAYQSFGTTLSAACEGDEQQQARLDLVAAAAPPIGTRPDEVAAIHEPGERQTEFVVRATGAKLLPGDPADAARSSVVACFAEGTYSPSEVSCPYRIFSSGGSVQEVTIPLELESTTVELREISSGRVLGSAPITAAPTCPEQVGGLELPEVVRSGAEAQLGPWLTQHLVGTGFAP